MENMESSQPSRASLSKELKELIFDAVNLKHLNPDEFSDATSLTTNGLELDSIDILEIVVAVEKKYQVTISDGDEGHRVFQTLGTIADFVETHRK